MNNGRRLASKGSRIEVKQYEMGKWRNGTKTFKQSMGWKVQVWGLGMNN